MLNLLSYFKYTPEDCRRDPACTYTVFIGDSVQPAASHFIKAQPHAVTDAD